MKILIVDDEQLARGRLTSLIAELPGTYQILEAAHGLEALKKVTSERPDVLLLDIRMPVMDGLEVAYHLSSLTDAPAVIFTTAYQDHALQAFEARAVDYLLKPVRKERLAQAIQRASVLQRAHIAEIRKQDTTLQPRTHLSATAQNNLRLVAVNEIRYFKAEQKYVVAGWPAGEILLDDSLVMLEQEFQSRFIRIHRNALIATEFIDALLKHKDGGFSLVLRGVPLSLQVSRRNISQLRKLIKQRT